MIKNERQYRITRARTDEARNAIAGLQRTPLPEGPPPEGRELQLDPRCGTLGDV